MIISFCLFFIFLENGEAISPDEDPPSDPIFKCKRCGATTLYYHKDDDVCAVCEGMREFYETDAAWWPEEYNKESYSHQ